MSTLRVRLRQLRGQARQAPDADLQALTQRIERLRGAARPAGREEARVADEQALAQVLNARCLRPGLLLLEHEAALSTRHGAWPLQSPPDRFETLPQFNGTGARDWLFLDTETTGLAGGSGTIAFQVGIARFRDSVLSVRQYLLTRFDAETDLLTVLAADVEGTETLVSYNGKSYDLPLLAARYRLNGVDNPFPVRPHLDLLHPMRRLHGKGWENCRLATVERRLLGFERRDDLPGAQAPKAWLEYIRTGAWKRLRGVLRHNRLDLISLAVALSVLERPGTVVSAGDRVAGTPVLRRAAYERLRSLRNALNPETAVDRFEQQAPD